MINAEPFTYNQVSDDFGGLNFSPYLPLTLSYGNNSIETSGLLDTGASVNVMPYQIGLQLGARWEQQNTSVRLAGNLANLPAYGLLITATVAQFAPVRLAFAWTRAENVPLILGQVNFFLEFDVCFFRAQKTFEIHPKTETR
ncbi:conserved hypothetical protein [Beggiatoa sp. PS]|nr:conserved hypothetical protein [Beggiatoa sp. PS]